jgi:hypothetical protein
MDKLEAQSGFAPAMKSMKIEISISAVLGHIRQYVHCSVLPGWIIRVRVNMYIAVSSQVG